MARDFPSTSLESVSVKLKHPIFVIPSEVEGRTAARAALDFARDDRGAWIDSSLVKQTLVEAVGG